MTSTGATLPGSANQHYSDPAGHLFWTDDGNITADDGSYAYVSYPGGGFPVDPRDNTSTALIGREFGFSIPTDVVIDGVLVEIKRAAGSGDITDALVALVISATLAGANKAGVTTWGGSFDTISYGGPTDLWELSLTPDDINNSKFGAGIAVAGVTGDAWEAWVDAMWITIYYSYPLGAVMGVTSRASVMGVTTPLRVMGVREPV